MTSEKVTKISELLPNQKMLYCKFIVLDVGEAISTKDGHLITTCRVADETASINLSLWDGKGKAIKPGDILKLSNGYTNIWKRSLTLYTGKAGHLSRIGEFLFMFAEIPYLSEKGLFPDVSTRNFKPQYNNEMLLDRPTSTTRIPINDSSYPLSKSIDHQVTKMSSLDQNGHENRSDNQPHTPIFTPTHSQPTTFNTNLNYHHTQNLYTNNISHLNLAYPPKTAYSPITNANMKQNNGSYEIDKLSKKF